MKRVFSGIQPTGHLTIGNYLGAIDNWVKMQKQFECIFCIVDLHAITIPQNPSALKEACLANLALYIASGLNPKDCTIFIQSSVAAHAELGWILSCLTPMGWLNRMVQFKDKAGKNSQNANLGLFAYPTLQAADILLYHATLVPVGEDQAQHLELARDIAGAFNRQYEVNYFQEPHVFNTKESARIMSLRDGRKKMSKSDPSDMSRINMTDAPELIMQKIRKATTDAIEGIYFDEEKRPEVSNLINIFAAFSKQGTADIEKTYRNSSTSEFKAELADAIIAVLQPIQREYGRLMSDRSHLANVTTLGCERAEAIATKTLAEVKAIVGLFTGF